MIAPSLTFNYQFEVQDSGFVPRRWIGQGSSQPTFNVEGLAGSKPRVELGSGWLTLFPTEGWARSFPIRAFSDQTRPHETDENARLADIKARSEMFMEAQKEAQKEVAEKVVSPKENFSAYMKENSAALERALRRRGLTRDFVSFSLFVGESLSNVLRIGDKLKYLRDGNADFHYLVERNSETIFSAGTVSRSNPGGPMAVWQEYDRHPNPNAEALKNQHLPFQVAEWLDVQKPYVTARIQEQEFHLLDGQDVQIDPYYVFLARSNQKVPVISFEFTPRAVHSAGRLDLLSKDQIIDAAQNRKRRLQDVLIKCS